MRLFILLGLLLAGGVANANPVYRYSCQTNANFVGSTYSFMLTTDRGDYTTLAWKKLGPQDSDFNTPPQSEPDLLSGAKAEYLKPACKDCVSRVRFNFPTGTSETQSELVQLKSGSRDFDGSILFGDVKNPDLKRRLVKVACTESKISPTKIEGVFQTAFSGEVDPVVFGDACVVKITVPIEGVEPGGRDIALIVLNGNDTEDCSELEIRNKELANKGRVSVAKAALTPVVDPLGMLAVIDGLNVSAAYFVNSVADIKVRSAKK